MLATGVGQQPVGACGAGVGGEVEVGAARADVGFGVDEVVFVVVGARVAHRTLAPYSARVRPTVGPVIAWVNDSTRMPSKGLVARPKS